MFPYSITIDWLQSILSITSKGRQKSLMQMLTWIPSPWDSLPPPFSLFTGQFASSSRSFQHCLPDSSPARSAAGFASNGR